MAELAIAVVVVVVASALCSGSEAALFSVPLNRARQLAEERPRLGRALLEIRMEMSRPIATIVILNNVANIVGSIVVARLATRVLGDAWLGVFSGCLTFLIIVGSEVVPKMIGERYAMSIAPWIAQPILVLATVLTPVLWLIEGLTSPLRARLEARGPDEPLTSESEIRLLARLGRREGVIEDDEADLVQRVFELNDRTAKDLMTPRTVMTYLSGDRALAESAEEIIAAPHSRIIIVGETPDDILGVALKDHLLVALVRRREQLLEELAEEVQFVPETLRADELLPLFRQTRQHLAVVVDEHGGVSGVVTLEDVLEVLTGPIADETDRWVNLKAVARLRARKRLREVLGKRSGVTTPEGE